MSKYSSRDKYCNFLDIDRMGILTPEVTKNVNTITELWALGRITKDIIGDPIWNVLYHLDCNPEPLENLGYSFNYCGYNGLYIPPRQGGVAHFALPKLASTNNEVNNKLIERINMANSMLTESKFTMMGNDVWLIYERFFSGEEDYLSMVEHILNNLKSGAEFFHKFS